MIIRMTFAENDWTDYLYQFSKGLRDRMFTDSTPCPDAYCDNFLEQYTIWRSQQEKLYETRLYLMNPDHHFRKKSKEYKMIVEEVIRLWREFAPSVNMQEDGDPTVSIQYSLKEQWENGEVLYYFTPQDVAVAM